MAEQKDADGGSKTPYRRVSILFWADAKIRALGDDAKFLFLCILTHPDQTSMGIMRGGPASLGEFLGWADRRIAKAFGEGLGKGLWEACPEAAVIWVPKFLKHNPPASPNVVRSWPKLLLPIPECILKAKAIAALRYATEGLSEGFAKAFGEAFGDGLPYTPNSELLTPNSNSEVSCAAHTPPPAGGKSDELPPGFIAFWTAYPKCKRKANRAGCLGVWKAKHLEDQAADVLAGLQRWTRDGEWAKDDGRFIPAPIVWLRGRRWEAEWEAQPAPEDDSWADAIAESERRRKDKEATRGH